MKLYYTKGACSLAVRITLNEIGIPYKAIAVDLKTKKTEIHEDYLYINPKGAVPALQLDTEEILTENAAIQQYLADTFKATHLLPDVNDLNRYYVLEWLNFISTELHKTCSPLFNPTMPEATREIFKKMLLTKLKFTDETISEKTFLLGDQFTIADSYLFVILSWLPHLQIDLTQFENLNRYFNQLKQRPTILKALKDENLM